MLEYIKNFRYKHKYTAITDQRIARINDMNMADTHIKGVSHGNTYMIERLMCSKKLENVYIAHNENGDKCIIKISEDASYIQNEYKLFNRLKKYEFIPYIFDLDDVILYNTLYHYIAMEYIEGFDLNDIIMKGLDCDKASLISRDLANIFLRLKQNGIYYTNLKLGNIIFDVNRKRFIIISFGAITYKDSEILDYTPPFDRTSWGIGLRVADSSYLSFEIGMLFVFIVIGEIMYPNDRNLADVIMIANKKLGIYYLPTMKALNGTYKLSKLIRDIESKYFDKKISNTLNYTLFITGIIFIILLRIAM